MTDAREKAAGLYCDGCNCAQAVLGAFCRETGLSEEQAFRLASSFGGGMGGLREVCGALTGGFMVLGMTLGPATPADNVKRTHNQVVREAAKRFRERHGAILCRELLQRNATDGTNKSEEKPCLKFVRTAAGIVTEMLEERRKGEQL